jgi:hypothetical protein
MYPSTVASRSVGLTIAAIAGSSVALACGQGMHNPRLRLVAADVQRARSLVLTTTDLPQGFHLYREHGDPLSKFTGSCGKLANPDLSALTETASVSGRVLANTDSGAEYLPTAAVFATASQAARAQMLQTGQEYANCAVSIIRNELKQLTAPYTVTEETQHIVARTEEGVVVRGRQAILDVKVSPNYLVRVQVSFVFLRRGRALSEIRMSSTWNAATRQTWNDAVSAATRRLKRSGF